MFTGSKNGRHHRCPRCHYVRRVEQLDATGRCLDEVLCTALRSKREANAADVKRWSAPAKALEEVFWRD